MTARVRDRLAKPQLLIVTLLFLIFVFMHYPQQIIGSGAPASLLGFERHALERILLIVPPVYAAYSMGLHAGLLSLAIAALCMFPRAILISVSPGDAAVECASALAVGALIAWLLEMRRRQIVQRDRMRRELRLYAQKISEAHEEERRRISRELHDDTIQTLVAVSRRLDNLVSLRLAASDETLGTLELLQRDINESVVRVRQFIQNLRSPTLEHLGLVPALREMVREASELGRVHVSLHTAPEMPTLGKDLEVHVYRIVEELLRNAVRHAAAAEVEVDLEARGDLLLITVEDDGVGFVPQPDEELLRAGRLGVVGIRERAGLLGGTVKIMPSDGRGTAVEVTLPFTWASSYPHP